MPDISDDQWTVQLFGERDVGRVVGADVSRAVQTREYEPQHRIRSAGSAKSCPQIKLGRTVKTIATTETVRL
jgi:hypothetical protein